MHDTWSRNRSCLSLHGMFCSMNASSYGRDKWSKHVVALIIGRTSRPAIIFQLEIDYVSRFH